MKSNIKNQISKLHIKMQNVIDNCKVCFWQKEIFLFEI